MTQEDLDLLDPSFKERQIAVGVMAVESEPVNNMVDCTENGSLYIQIDNSSELFPNDYYENYTPRKFVTCTNNELCAVGNKVPNGTLIFVVEKEDDDG